MFYALKCLIYFAKIHFFLNRSNKMFLYVHLLFSVLPVLNHLTRHTICSHNRLCTYRYQSSCYYISIGISLFIAPPLLIYCASDSYLLPTRSNSRLLRLFSLTTRHIHTHTHTCSPFNIKLHIVVGPGLSKTFDEHITYNAK